MFKKVTIFGFDFISADNVSEIADDIISKTLSSDKGKPDFLITPNAFLSVAYSEPKNKEIKQYYKQASYILPDGMPIVWLSNKVSKHPLKARLTGSDLFPALWQRIKKNNLPATMVLPSEELGEMFVKDYEQCNYLAPKYFQADDEAYISAFSEKVADSIIANNSRFLFLGLTFPKQDKIGMAVAEKLKQKGYDKQILILLLGASYEFYFGMKKRAPTFFRNTGLEWLYRFASEPKRLWKRYTVDNIRFIKLALKELKKAGR